MSDKLKVSLVQCELFWEDPKTNKQHIKTMVDGVSADLIILPEMFTTGFTMNPSKHAESMDGETISWMIEMAKSKNAAITGSLIIKDSNHYYNRLLFVFPNGKLEFYDKRHTFTLAGEDKIYASGSKRLIVDYKGWKICPLICYDLRFPVWSRNTEDYDVLLYVANWPKPRISAWDSLLKARAIENMCYCIGVNRVGLDGNNHEYPGHSACYDALGKQICNSKPNKEQQCKVTLDKNHLNTVRNKLRFLDDRDSFNLIM